MAPTTQLRWTSAFCSDVGRVRQINEDTCLDQPTRGLWVVADGMGGHALGDLASRMVVESLNQLPPSQSLENFIADARDRLLAVNRQLREEAVIHDAKIIGSTVVALLAFGNRCACLWAGDSRIYLFRGGRLQMLTRDHSQIEELKSLGNFSIDDSRLLARNLITRAVGAADELDLDEEITDVRDGDMFLLCSDGLTNEVDEQEMTGALITGNCEQAAQTLVDLALQHGGRDNVSVVVVHAEDPDSVEQTVLNPAL